jgi:hypothetical protein
MLGPQVNLSSIDTTTLGGMLSQLQTAIMVQKFQTQALDLDLPALLGEFQAINSVNQTLMSLCASIGGGLPTGPMRSMAGLAAPFNGGGFQAVCGNNSFQQASDPPAFNGGTFQSFVPNSGPQNQQCWPVDNASPIAYGNARNVSTPRLPVDATGLAGLGALQPALPVPAADSMQALFMGAGLGMLDSSCPPTPVLQALNPRPVEVQESKKRKRGQCEHARQKHQCKKCGGGGICTHGRRKSQCKECGGSAICAHGRQKYQCKECGGSAICKHGRVKYQCKECGGSAICEHARLKHQCKQCGGGGICDHGRRKSQCKTCGGSGICQHGRQKHRCKECGSAAVGVCQHGRKKSLCADCSGAGSQSDQSDQSGKSGQSSGSECEHGLAVSECSTCNVADI